MVDNTYQPKVYREQGGDRLAVKEDGNLNFFDQDFTGSNLRLLLLSLQTFTTIAQSGTGLVGSTLQTLSPAYGYYTFSAATAMSLGSAYLPAPVKGAMLFLNGIQLVIDANLSVIVGSFGASLVNPGSVALSSFEISALGYARLICQTAGVWSVVDANYLEHAEV